MQGLIAEPQCLNGLCGIADVVGVRAGLAVPLPDDVQLGIEGQSARILRVPAIDDVGQRADTRPPGAAKRHHSPDLAVHHGDLFAGAQIGNRRLPVLGRDPEGQSPAGTAAVEPQDEAWPLRRSPVDMAVDAERAMEPGHGRQLALDESEARPPHQGTIAENPQIARLSQSTPHSSLGSRASRPYQWPIGPRKGPAGLLTERIGMPLPSIIVPVGLAVLAIGGWTAIWHFGAGRAEAIVDQAIAREAARGRTLACGERSRGGYPFRLEITCTRASVNWNDATRLELPELKVVSQIWDPRHVIAELTGPMSLARSDTSDTQALSLSWRLAQASAVLTLTGYEQASLVLDDPVASRAGERLIAARRADVHLRPKAEEPVSLDVATSLTAATFGTTPGLPIDSQFVGILRNINRTAGRPQIHSLSEWRAAGGAVEITRFRVAQGDAVGLASGRVGLTQDGRPDGRLDVRIANAEAALQATGLGALLGPMGMAAFTFASQPGEVEGRPGRVLTLNARGGAVQIGPLRLPLPVVVD